MRTKRILIFGVPVLLIAAALIVWAVSPGYVRRGGSAVSIVVDKTRDTNHQTGDIRILAVVQEHNVRAASLLGPGPTSEVYQTTRDGDRTDGPSETEAAKETAWRFAWNLTKPAEQMPPRAQIPTPDLNGPSLGLASALAYVDALTDGDLTGGKLVAATGVIAADGRVSPIGGVEVKARTARDVGVHLLLVPDENFIDARLAVAGDTRGMRIVPVTTIREAVETLCSSGGEAPGVCPER